MIFYILIYLSIIFLIYTNALTDAPNAISTLVGTKVMSFRKAAIWSAFFNVLGIIFMCFVSLSVANTITEMVSFTNKIQGLCIVFSGIIATIIFANTSMFFGIPTSETHAIVAGLTGAILATGGIEKVSIDAWSKIGIGLFFSIVGTFFITKIFYRMLKNKNSLEKNRFIQILSSLGVSFMHGAQDGQKFIGILIVFYCVMNGFVIPKEVLPEDCIWIIVVTCIIMFIGVSTGGRRIVETLGNDLTVLNRKNAVISDISTVFILLVSSINGLPVSTSHVKTVSIISSTEEKVNFDKFFDIVKAWFFTFPVCIGLAFWIMKFLMRIYMV